MIRWYNETDPADLEAAIDEMVEVVSEYKKILNQSAASPLEF